MKELQQAPTEEPLVELVEAPQFLSPEERLANAESVMGRLAAGEEVDPASISPLTHPLELVAIVSQAAKHRSGF